MSGYYEWVEMDDAKQPHCVHAFGEPLLHAAGLTTAEKNSDGDWDVSFTIITREATVAAGEVHDHMPAFLYEELMNEWLASGLLRLQPIDDRKEN